MRVFSNSSRAKSQAKVVTSLPHESDETSFSMAPAAPVRRMTKGDKNLIATGEWSGKTKLKLEDPVSVVDSKACALHGVVAFVGEVHFDKGLWVGVQLTGPSVGKGYHDGVAHGRRYFGSVGKKNGVLVHISQVQRRVKAGTGDASQERIQKARQTPKAQLAEVQYVETLKKERETAILKKSKEKKKRFKFLKPQTEEIYIQRMKQKNLQDLRMSRSEPIEGDLLDTEFSKGAPRLKFAGLSSKLCKADYEFMKGLQEAQQNYVITDPTLPDNPVTIASQAFQNMTRYNLSEILGKNCRFLQGPKTGKQQVGKIRRAVEEGSDCSVCLENYRKDGTTFWNEFFITALRDNRGRIKNYIGVLCEVSAEVAAKRIELDSFDQSRQIYQSKFAGQTSSEEEEDRPATPSTTASSNKDSLKTPNVRFLTPQPTREIQEEDWRANVPSSMPERGHPYYMPDEQEMRRYNMGPVPPYTAGAGYPVPPGYPGYPGYPYYPPPHDMRHAPSMHGRNPAVYNPADYTRHLMQPPSERGQDYEYGMRYPPPPPSYMQERNQPGYGSNESSMRSSYQERDRYPQGPDEMRYMAERQYSSQYPSEQEMRRRTPVAMEDQYGERYTPQSEMRGSPDHRSVESPSFHHMPPLDTGNRDDHDLRDSHGLLVPINPRDTAPVYTSRSKPEHSGSRRQHASRGSEQNSPVSPHGYGAIAVQDEFSRQFTRNDFTNPPGGEKSPPSLEESSFSSPAATDSFGSPSGHPGYGLAAAAEVSARPFLPGMSLTQIEIGSDGFPVDPDTGDVPKKKKKQKKKSKSKKGKGKSDKDKDSTRWREI